MIIEIPHSLKMLTLQKMKPRHIYLGLALLLVCTPLVCSQESNSAPPAAKAESPLKPIRRLGTETFRINSAITGFVLAENRGSVLVTTNTDTKLREIDLRTGAVTELLDLQKQLLPDATRRTRNLYYYEPINSSSWCIQPACSAPT